MVQDVLGRDPFGGLSPQQRADEATGSRGQALGNDEVTSRDFRKERSVLGIVKGIPKTKETLLTIHYTTNTYNLIHGKIS